MKPIKIAFMWHQHQPYYRKENTFILPWVRLHAIKDYLDLPELLFEFPKIKQTINLVPSLLKQIEEYISKEAEDLILQISRKESHNLTIDDKEFILKSFFLCNEENMIYPYPRYKELFQKSKEHNAIDKFNDDDWRDIQVWYNLTWFGPLSRKDLFVDRMLKKGAYFTEIEKQLLIEKQFEIMSKIIKQMQNLSKLGQVEISCSPFYHPILPLVYNTDSALESMPELDIPKSMFSFPEDADAQISKGIEYFINSIGFSPNGFWPSEGSVSNAIIELFIKNGINWIATDEDILKNSLINTSYLDKYFPWTYINQHEKEIKLFFRDHHLSDNIGFHYSKWNSYDAANDFINKILNVRNDLINNYGENSLDNAVISIILDGENCWEYYRDNGILFLRELYTQISNNELIETVLFKDMLNSNLIDRKISNIKAGSWIYGNFNIWIGHSEHLKAWMMLNDVRKLIEKKKNEISINDLTKIMEEIYIAEGSDWFWWYGDSHYAPNKYDFDKLFRWHIQRIYNLLNETPPNEVYLSINSAENDEIIKQPKNMIFPKIIDDYNDNDWLNSGEIMLNKNMSTMHQIGEIISKIRFGNNDNNIFFNISLKKEDLQNSEINIIFINNYLLEVNLTFSKILLKIT